MPFTCTECPSYLKPDVNLRPCKWRNKMGLCANLTAGHLYRMPCAWHLWEHECPLEKEPRSCENCGKEPCSYLKERSHMQPKVCNDWQRIKYPGW